MRYQQTGTFDTGHLEDHDHSLTGVNMALESCVLDSGTINTDVNRQALWPGTVAAATNYRFRRGMAEPRLGMVEPAWANAETIGAVHASGVWADPDDAEHILLATAAGVWVLRSGYHPRMVGYATGESVSGPAEFVQCFDRMLLLRGADAAPLEWDGDIRGEWVAVEQTDASPTSGTEQIPNGDWAFLLANRLWIAHGRDSLAASDLLDYTRYDALLSDFRINSGEADRIVHAVPYGATSVVIFKEGSIYKLDSVSGDLTSMTLEVVSRQVGCVARRSVCQVGADLVILSVDGVFTVAQALDTQVAARRNALSFPIYPLLDRVNWSAASGACAAAHDGIYRLAVPIDGSTYNNAVIVYDTASQQWQGLDQCAQAGWRVDRFAVCNHFGRRRLFAIDEASGKVRLCDEGYDDQLGGSVYQIAHSLTSRGHLCNTADRKRFRRLSLELSTWAPTYTVSAAVEGQAETETLVSGATRSRTRYFQPWGKADWDATNAGDDHATQGREDYSVLSSQNLNPKSGVNPQLHQSHAERHTLRSAGRALSLTVSATAGRVCVRGIHTEALPEASVPRNQG